MPTCVTNLSSKILLLDCSHIRNNNIIEELLHMEFSSFVSLPRRRLLHQEDDEEEEQQEEHEPAAARSALLLVVVLSTIIMKYKRGRGAVWAARIT